jgi:hypothetical protein
MYGAMVSADTGHDYVQVHVLKASDIEGLETEEESKRHSFKEQTHDVDFVFALLLQQFVQHQKNESSFTTYSSCIALTSSASSGFDVLRL